MEISREEMLMNLGAARAKAPTAWRLVDIEMDKQSPTSTYALNRKKLRRARRREGRYLLRTNLTENDPALLWQYYIQLVAVEQAFKNLKQDLAIRPVFHQDEHRIEAGRHASRCRLAGHIYARTARLPPGTRILARPWCRRSCRACSSTVIVHPRCPAWPGIWEMSMYNQQLRHWLARIAGPTLVFWGESDGVVTPDYGRAYARG